MEFDLTTVGAVLFVLSPLAALILRVFVMTDEEGLDRVWVPRFDLEWPYGVPDEDFVPWHVERLTPHERGTPGLIVDAPVTRDAVAWREAAHASLGSERTA